MKRLQKFWQSLRDDPIKLIGYLLFLIALVLGVAGYINQNAMVEYNGEMVRVYKDSPFLRDFYANIAAELASIAITILIIDYFYDDREQKKLKAQLIRQLGSKYNDLADIALKELRYHGWLKDGSLANSLLSKANLNEIDLSEANFKMAFLDGAQLQGAKFRNAILEEALLNDAKCQKTEFGHANLKGVRFRHADCESAIFINANLSEAIFQDTNLKFANLRDANLKNSFLRGADLDGANLEGANLEGVNNPHPAREEYPGFPMDSSLLSRRRLSSSRLNKNTTMPNGEKFTGWEEGKDYGLTPD